MKWEQAKSMEKEIERKRDRLGGEKKGGGSKERKGGKRDSKKGEWSGKLKRSKL